VVGACVCGAVAAWGALARLRLCARRGVLAVVFVAPCVSVCLCGLPFETNPKERGGQTEKRERSLFGIAPIVVVEVVLIVVLIAVLEMAWS